MKKFYTETIGAFHIHSKFSDGTGSLDDIVKCAKKTNLAFIIITDHNSLDIKEGIFDGVTVIKGEEISKKNENHYISLNTTEKIISTEPEDFIEEVRKKGGFGFICHPFESKKRKNSSVPICWQNEEIMPDGVEIWNWFSNFADNYNNNNIFTNAIGYFLKNKIVKSPQRKTLNFWDKLNSKTKKIIPAIGGVDAHALKVKKYMLEFCIFPYDVMFKTINNILYLNEPLGDNFEENKKNILKAIKEGKNLIINRNVSENYPEVKVINSLIEANSGQEILLDNYTYLIVKSPLKQNIINVIKDGNLIKKTNKNSLTIQVTETGKYRVEIKSGKYGFAYSNPIYVKRGEIDVVQ